MEKRKPYPRRQAKIGDIVMTYSGLKHVAFVQVYEKVLTDTGIKSYNLRRVTSVPVGSPGFVLAGDQNNRKLVLFSIGPYWIWETDIGRIDWVEMRNSWRSS